MGWKNLKRKVDKAFDPEERVGGAENRSKGKEGEQALSLEGKGRGGGDARKKTIREKEQCHFRNDRGILRVFPDIC